LATTESYAHPLYKQKIVEVDEEGSTEYTHVFGRARWPGAAHRVLKTPFFETWKNKIAADETEFGQPIIGSTTIFDNVSYSTGFRLCSLVTKRFPFPVSFLV